MIRPIMILGASGGAHDILDLIEAINACRPSWHVVGFLDDALTKGSRHLGIEVLGPLEDASRHSDCRFVNAMGGEIDYSMLPEFVARTGVGADFFATLIHPGASVSHRARLGRGVLVDHSVIVGGGAIIGDCVRLGPGSIVGHDSIIREYSLVAAAAVLGALIVVERNCYIGARSVIAPGIRIGEGSMVGIGAVVEREVESDSRVVGNPARRLSRAEPRFAGSQDNELRWVEPM